MVNTNFLRIPMHMLLYNVQDIDAYEGLPPRNADLLWTEYNEEEIRNLVEALQFAADNPSFDFAALMPEIEQPNHKIYLFLCKILASIRAAMARRTSGPAEIG
ncbi:MAG: hypothetical protein QOH33_883 [Paraburkholderia sp.]|jgi:hypothetical protein|nr:hypothetical protein [Paraburkholderia sp.]